MTKSRQYDVVDDLVDLIDAADVLAGNAKAAMISDVEGEILRVEGELIAMKRALRQYQSASINLQGRALGVVVKDALQQLARLRDYRDELLALPGDAKTETEAGVER